MERGCCPRRLLAGQSRPRTLVNVTMQLDWLSEYDYRKCPKRPDGIEVWVCRDCPARLNVNVSAELCVTATGMFEGDDFVELSVGLHDENLCYVQASIDRVRTQDLRSRLTWYESRVLAMLEAGG